MSEISIREKCGLLVYYPLATGALSGKYRNGQMPKILGKLCSKVGKDI